MKHLFTIHSSITFLVAYSTVKHLRLDEKDVVFISSGYEPPIGSLTIVRSFQDINTGWSRKIRTFNAPKSYDKYIDEITERKPFIAYVDLMSYYQKILVTHKRCEEFHFIEEGNSTYQEFDDLMDITWCERTMAFRSDQFDKKSLIRILRGYNLRLLGLPYNYAAYTNMNGIRFFSFSINAFYNIPKEKRVLIKPDSTDPKIQEMAGRSGLKEEVIWIDGSNARFTGLTEDYYHEAIQKAIDKMKVSGIISKKVFVKLRPGLKDYSQNKLIGILRENNIEVEVLPDKMVLECLFICSKNCYVIGTLTSALEYAHVFGHKAYSVYDLFEKQPPTFFDRMTGFWKNVEKL